MKDKLKKIIKEAIVELKKQENWPNFEMPEIKIENTKEKKFGDFSTNIAMILASNIKINPFETAEKISEILNKKFKEDIKKIEAVKPGYINFYLSQKYLSKLIKKILKENKHFGDSKIGNRQKVNNEFISANPTGPLHLGNGRGGFYGDCLSNVLKKCDYDVIKEYYVNDAGEQMIKLGHSVLKDKKAVYAGEYIEKLNERLPEIRKKLGSYSEDVEKIGYKVSELILKEIIESTVEEKMQIKEVHYVSERTLYSKRIDKDSYVNEAISFFEIKNLIEKKDGAFWLKTSQFGDDKDRVLIKKDGNKTYFASDCGYLLYKIERGFNTIIEIWGADHHGYIQRFEAAAKALGFQGELKFIIVQLVRLMKDGKEARMSKRAGNVFYIDELIEKVGHDVTRFFFLMYSPDSHMNFDLGLAEEKSQKNPVYYVQYAHARICSILEKAENFEGKGDLKLLNDEKELSLMRELNKFPDLVEEISGSYEVHKLPYYAISLADKFHSFYNACRVIDEENEELTKARLSLVKAAKIVLGETLQLIGVSAPEKM